MVQATLRGHKIRNAKSINYDEVRGITQVEVLYHLRTGCKEAFRKYTSVNPCSREGPLLLGHHFTTQST
jgi:hypothetical protein